jgi:molecular chaperone GrpE
MNTTANPTDQSSVDATNATPHESSNTIDASPSDANHQPPIDNASTDTNVDTITQRIEAAEAKAQEHYEQLLRSTAEMVNLRKRHATEIESAHKYALEKFANELLATKDSLEAAIDMLTKKPDDVTVLKEGVELTLRQLSQSFEKFKITELNPVAQAFNPNQHQAISMAPHAEIPNNHVIQVLQKGYLIAERVLRPALVIVSQG